MAEETSKEVRNELVPAHECHHSGTIAENFDKLSKDFSEMKIQVTTELSDFKVRSLEQNAKLEKILAGLQATLEMSIREHERFDADVRKNTTDIGVLRTDVEKIKSDVKVVEGNVADHGKRISTIEKISYWIYAGVAVIMIIAFIVSHYTVGRDIIDHHRSAIGELVGEQKSTTNHNTPGQHK